MSIFFTLTWPVTSAVTLRSITLSFAQQFWQDYHTLFEFWKSAQCGFGDRRGGLILAPSPSGAPYRSTPVGRGLTAVSFCNWSWPLQHLKIVPMPMLYLLYCFNISACWHKQLLIQAIGSLLNFRSNHLYLYTYGLHCRQKWRCLRMRMCSTGRERHLA